MCLCSRPMKSVTFKNTVRRSTFLEKQGNRRGVHPDDFQQQRQTPEIVKDFASEAKNLGKKNEVFAFFHVFFFSIFPYFIIFQFFMFVLFFFWPLTRRRVQKTRTSSHCSSIFWWSSSKTSPWLESEECVIRPNTNRNQLTFHKLITDSNVR